MIANRTKVLLKHGAGLPVEFTEGVVVGVLMKDIPFLGCVYAIDVGQVVSCEYPYQVVGVAEIHLHANPS